MKILEFENITKRFFNITALHKVNFFVEEGEILGIAGENGAGKSTLMKIISGVYEYGSYEGNIKVDGKISHFHSPRDAERAGISMIYQELSMHLDMSVAENLFLGDWLKRKNGVINWNGMHQKSQEILKQIGIEDIDPHCMMRELSKARQQMVAVCRALRTNPRILIMDEPTAALPQKEVEKLFQVMRTLKKRGITVLLITHRLDEIFDNCDRIVVLRNGEVVAGNTVKEVSMQDIVTQMIGRSIKLMYPKKQVPIGEEVLRLEGITVRHPFNSQKNIVENIGFTLHKGEILGLEGLAGSGRSELLSVIFGKPGLVKGSIFVNGKKTAFKCERDAINAGIAMVTEDRRDDGFVGYMSVRDNITLASLLQISKAGFIRDRKEKEEVTSLAEKLRIKASSLDEAVENLSGGNQQKVVLSKWLMTKPAILIMDEPTRGVDVGAKTEIYGIMTELVQQGIGIIFTSSERVELLEMCDRIVVLSSGTIKGDIPKEKFDEKEIVRMEVV